MIIEGVWLVKATRFMTVTPRRMMTDRTNSLSTTVPTQSYSSSGIFSASLWVLHCCPKLIVKNHAKNCTRFEKQSAVLWSFDMNDVRNDQVKACILKQRVAHFGIVSGMFLNGIEWQKTERLNEFYFDD